MFDGAECFLVAAAGSQAGVLGGEVDVLGADRGHRGFLQGPASHLEPAGEEVGEARERVVSQRGSSSYC